MDTRNVDATSDALARALNKGEWFSSPRVKQAKRSLSSFQEQDKENKENLDGLEKECLPAKLTCSGLWDRANTSFVIPSNISSPISIQQPKPMRASSSQLLTSVLILDSSVSSSGSETDSSSVLDHSLFQDIPSYHPALRASCFTPRGTPLFVEVETVEEDGSILTHQLKLALRAGAANIYSNDPELKPVTRMPSTTLCKSHPSLQKENVIKVKPAKADQKTQTLEITPTQQKEITKRDYRNQNREMATSPSHQSSVSASGYVQQFDLDIKKCEWLHLIAYFLAGEKAQNEENLVAGTAHANTDMLIAIEKHIPLIKEAYPESFTINVKAELQSQGSQVANTIHYTVTTKDFEFTLIFNAQATNKPHVIYQLYFERIIKHIIETHANKSIDAARPVEKSTFLTPPRLTFPYYKKVAVPTAPKKNYWAATHFLERDQNLENTCRQLVYPISPKKV